MTFSPRLLCRRFISGAYSRCSPHTRRMSTAAPIIPSKTVQSHTSPWLMLPPVVGDTSPTVNYNFYSFAESKLITRPQLNGGADDLRVRGSSHGWLALFNPITLDLFLYNPISLRHITLPPIPNFPKGNRRGVTKVTLSASPDDDNCRAAVIYAGELAFCRPGHSKEWTPITSTRGNYNEFVYSTRQNLFFGLNKSYELETWDLSNLSSPKMIKAIKTADKFDDVHEDDDKGLPKGKVKYIVADVNEHHHVVLVTWSFADYLLPDDTPASPDLYPQLNTAFRIDVYDQVQGEMKPLAEEGLGDSTLFIGCHGDSAALPAARFPELKPNTIYFTRPFEATSQGSRIMYGWDDFGIFHVEHNTKAGCYIPCEIRRVKKVVPSNVWFFPRP